MSEWNHLWEMIQWVIALVCRPFVFARDRKRIRQYVGDQDGKFIGIRAEPDNWIAREASEPRLYQLRFFDRQAKVREGFCKLDSCRMQYVEGRIAVFPSSG